MSLLPLEILPVPAWAERLAVFDLETTGIDVEDARIVTAHIGVLGPDGGVELSWQWLADPAVIIPDAATAVHGITTMKARTDGAPAAEVISEIIARLSELLDQGIPLVIYNAPYDLTVLDREALRHGLIPLTPPTLVVDPLVIDKALDRYRRGKRTLTATTEHYGILLDGAHDATADAIAAGRVAQALARHYPDLLDMSAERLHATQAAWAREQAERFTDWVRSKGDLEFVASGDWPQR